jgi:diguanylate cyclase (GGDEF)-like protein
VRDPIKAGGLLKPFLSVLALLCAMPAVVSSAQRYSFREYTEGLGNLNIACLVQDHTGYLWVGTQNGLYRYDGTKFQSFGAAQGVPERMIQSLYVSPDGTLWVATTTGIFFEQRDGHFVEVKSPIPGGQFPQKAGTVFTANRPDQVVTVTRDSAFLLRRSSEEQWVAESMHLEGGNLHSVLYGQDGALWYGCDSDICRMAGGKTTRMSQTLKLPEEKWSNLLLTRDGHIWIRGAVHVGEIDPRTNHFELHDLPGAMVSEAYPALAEDAQGRVITSQGPSLGLWEKDHWRMVTERNGLPRFEIQDLYVDREGSVWIGVVGHGLKRWVGQDHWEGYTAADGLGDDLVWNALRDQKGRLWIGTESGLDYIPAGQVTPRAWRQAGIVTSRAGALGESADGAIWMGSTAGALVRIDPNSLLGTQWRVPEVYDVQADNQQHIWVATSAGLYEADAKGSSHGPALVENHVFGNPRQRFADLCLDASGHMWAAADEGLFLLDEKGWHRIDLGASGANPDLIAIDQQGYIWAGGSTQDFMRLRVEGYKVVEIKHIGRPPLLSEQVVSLMVDHRGWVWAGQDAGLTVFDGHAWRSYTQDDGLIWNDTDSFALAEDKDGSMWIGTSGGLSHLLTPDDAPAGAPQAPAFSQVTYGNTVLGNGSSAQWSSNLVEISMALLSFTGTHEAGIRYRLVGLQSSEWELTRDMEVHYRNLAPGFYRFEVAEADQAGHPISPVASFAFQITPRWWQSRALQIAVAILIIAGLVAAWRHRVGLLMYQKRQLEDAVQRRTVDLEREKGELMRTREQMRHYAEHDDLTGLWNHRIIVERLRIEVDRSRREGMPLSVILADLDFFKRINDTYGHPAGDQVLREASAILQRMVRSYDWVGRYGGEEFLLILPGSGFLQARERAEDLRLAFENARVQEDDTVIPLTASFGVASGFPASHEDLIREADAALYRAKDNGRNCVVATEIDSRRMSVVRAR